MNITVEVKAPDLADAINNLSVAIANILSARAEHNATVVADKAVKKASAKKAEVSEPAHQEAPEIDAVALKVEIHKLAQVKSKLAGAVAVRDTIVKFGSKNINTTEDSKLVELKAALEALS